MTFDEIIDRIAVGTWNAADRERGRRAVRLAEQVYEGISRDHGTLYIEHPVAVAEILRDEAGLTFPKVLLIGLLHDALEVRPDAAVEIAAQLGEPFVEVLRALTPDHRLAGRSRNPGDDDAYHRKVSGLPNQLLAIKLADRVHNLRELSLSNKPERSSRFRTQLVDFYLPLATARATTYQPIALLAALLARGSLNN